MSGQLGPVFTLLNTWVNIGNAFVDMGSAEMIRQAVPNARLHKTSMFPTWLFSEHAPSRSLRRLNGFTLTDKVKTDVLVLSGMMLSEWFVGMCGPAVIAAAQKGVRIVINGAGGGDYNPGEVAACRAFLETIRPISLILRDSVAYEHYGDLAEHSHCGLDCAFYVSDCFDPLALDLGEFEVRNFDRMADPLPPDETRTIVRTHHSAFLLPDRKSLGMPNVMVSEYPEDYLNLYANATVTHTDRVHACVATLAFGNRCRLHRGTPRAKLFERVGLDPRQMTEDVLFVDADRVAEVKREQLEFLRMSLSCLAGTVARMP